MSNQSTTLNREKKETFINFYFSRIKTYVTKGYTGVNSKLFRNIGMVIMEVGFLMILLAGYNLWTGSNDTIMNDASVVIDSTEAIVLSLDMGVITMITGCLIMIIASDKIISDHFFKKN